MKKIWIAAALMAVQCVGFAQVNLYVAENGSDDNIGTKEAPLQTIGAARELLRTRPQKEAVVHLAPGRYFFNRTFELRERDSNVTYKADKPGTVFFDGGVFIPAEACKKVSDAETVARLIPEAAGKIMSIDLKKLGIENYGNVGPRGFARPYVPAPLELFINGKALSIARWPNKGEKLVQLGKVLDKGNTPRTGDYGLRGATFKAGTDRIKRWKKAEDLYLSGILCWGYADDMLPIKSIDQENGTITLGFAHVYGLAQKRFTKWFALNLIEEIDLPGEYCVDALTGKLYFYPPCDLTGAKLQVSMIEEPLVAIEYAKNVRFENITFENARGNAVYIEGGEDNVLAGCTFRNLGLLAVQMGPGAGAYPPGQTRETHAGANDGWGFGYPVSRELGTYHGYGYVNTAWYRDAGKNNGLQSCAIYDTGAGGVLLGGGDRVTLEPAGNFVDNCDISNVNRWNETYCCPVNVDGVGNRITHNRMHDCAGQAILLHGNDHLIEFNRMFECLQNMSDQGVIYMGRDPSESGTMIRYNFFHDIYDHHPGSYGVQGIFFDDMCTFGASIIGNVFYRTGNSGVVKFNGGGESPIINNIMIDCPRGLQKNGCSTARVVKHMMSDMGQTRLIKDVNIIEPPYSTKYPQVAAIYNGERELQFPYERNYEVRGDYSQFVDPANWNFDLRKDSEVFSKVAGFEAIPFAQIGLYKDAWRKALPAELPPIERITNLSDDIGTEYAAHAVFVSDLVATDHHCHGQLRNNCNYSLVGPVLFDSKIYSKSLMICPTKSTKQSFAKYDMTLYKGKMKFFKALVAIDDAAKGSASFIVETVTNGKTKQLIDTGVIRGGQPPKEINVSINGADELILRCTDGGDGTGGDHAAWANARLE